jgi:hypothetical protein
MKNIDYDATSHSVEDLEETLILSIPTLMEQDHEKS